MIQPAVQVHNVQFPIAAEVRRIVPRVTLGQVMENIVGAEIELRDARRTLHSLEGLLAIDSPMVRAASRRYQEKLEHLSLLRSQVQVAQAA
jgi:hypothetical protein